METIIIVILASLLSYSALVILDQRKIIRSLKKGIMVVMFNEMAKNANGEKND